MNPEIKQKWVEALRSGKYQQGVGRLKFGGRYCCLGVLCDVAGLPFDGGHAGLNLEQQEATGVDDLGTLPKPVKGHFLLTHLNDQGYDFNQIADIIEEQL